MATLHEPEYVIQQDRLQESPSQAERAVTANERLSGETSGLSDTSCGAEASHLMCSTKVTKEIFKKTHMYFYTMCTCTQDTPKTVSDTQCNPPLLRDDLQATSVPTPHPWLCCPACGILVPPPGTEPGHLAVEVCSPDTGPPGDSPC